jgi:hypothetical protein
MTDLIKIEGQSFDLEERAVKPPRLRGMTDWFWSVVDRCWTANYDEYFNKPGKVKSRHPAEHT